VGFDVGGLSPEGWLPDRISVGALTRVYPPELVDRVLEETDTVEVRRRSLPSRMVVYFVLALWLFRGPNCGYVAVLTKLVDGLYYQRRAGDLLAGRPVDRSWEMPNQSSLTRGRTRVGSDPVRMLLEHAAGPIGKPGEAGVFLRDLRMIIMDGSTYAVPNDPKGLNLAAFGVPSNSDGDGSHPQVRFVIAAEAGTGSLLGAAVGAYMTGERTLVHEELLGVFGPGMLTMADRGFLSYELARAVLATGAHLLWRASASFGLAPVRKLRDGTYLARLHPPRTVTGEPITVRVIEYTVHSTTDDGTAASEVFCLVTDLLDPEAWPFEELAYAYPVRWTIETIILRHKVDVGKKQPVLRSKDPEGVYQEMWALFAVYQALALLIGFAAGAVGAPPGSISFPAALAAAEASVTDAATGAFPP
jgi:Insertion element 4 transposase N-terminal/Transposase DDE domain